MNDARRFETLSEAIAEYSGNIPVENRPLIRRVAQAIGISHYRTFSYIRRSAARRSHPHSRLRLDGKASSAGGARAAGDEVEIGIPGAARHGRSGFRSTADTSAASTQPTATPPSTACPVCGLTERSGACSCD